MFYESNIKNFDCLKNDGSTKKLTVWYELFENSRESLYSISFWLRFVMILGIFYIILVIENNAFLTKT